MTPATATEEAANHTRALSERAKYRLRLVAKLFKSRRRSFDESTPSFYSEVLAAIAVLEPD